jgi:hypothetical protein
VGQSDGYRAVRWYLREVRDANGNRMKYEYETSQGTVQCGSGSNKSYGCVQNELNDMVF